MNLAPADLRKAGPAYDLPIAMAVLLSSGQVSEIPGSALLLGELSLDGSLRHTNGVLPMVVVAREEGFDAVFVPSSDAREAELVEGIEIMPVESLSQLTAHLRGDAAISPFSKEQSNGDEGPKDQPRGVDLADIRGQEHAKRALEVAAAGGHNLLMSGPPGSGKTLLARALPSILPGLTQGEALEVTKIYSVSGLLPASSPLVTERTFRSPHYTISNAGLVGGGRLPRPWEITLSHRGVLFLDELPEFGHTVLEVLRQPLEDKVVTISRAPGDHHLSGQLHACGGHEPLRLRVRQRPCKGMRLHPQRHIQVQEAHQWPADGPLRSIRGGAKGRVRKAGGALQGRDLGPGPPTNTGGSPGPKREIRREGYHYQR